MNVNVNSTTNFTVTGKTRSGLRVPAPSGVTITVPHSAPILYDGVTGKGSFVAPATTGTDTFTASDGALTPYASPVTYILDPNEVVALDVTFP